MNHSSGLSGGSAPQQPHPNGGFGVGGHRHHSTAGGDHPPPPKWHSYKMLVDPTIHKGAPKMMRYDGLIVPGNPHHVPPTLTDPRNKLPNALWRRMEPMDLPVPKFKIDEFYVGEPPKVEVTVENMNDNIDKAFLRRMVEKFGVIEEIDIYYHPVTGKHLGLAHLCFEEVKSAKECARVLHGKSVMGLQLNCYVDPLAKSCNKVFAELTEEKKPEPPPPLPPPPPPVVNQQQLPLHPALEEHQQTEFDEDPMLHENLSPHVQNDAWPGNNFRRREGGREDPRRTKSIDRDRRGSRDTYRETRKSEDQPDLASNSDDRYQVTRFDPNYWQAQAAQYAASVQQQGPPDDELKNEVPEVKEENELNDDDEGSDHKIDLDTRLKQLMKGRAMPSFLHELNGSEDESEEEAAKVSADQKQSLETVMQAKLEPPVFNEDPPLSRPPSPFKSESHYLTCHQSWQAERLDEFNKLHKLVKGSPKSDDRMSVSGLSGVENNILEHGAANGNNYYGYYPPPPGYDPMAPPNQAWYGQHYMQPPNQWPPGYSVPHQHGEYPDYYDPQGTWQDPYAVIKESLKAGKSDRNVFRPIIKEAVNAVVDDLTNTLTKDMNKRMCETLAIYLFEKWWQEQETKYKAKHSNVPSVKGLAAKILPSTKPTLNSTTAALKDEPSTTPVSKLPRIPRAEDISTLFDKHRESLETTGLRASSFGFGFRGTIPKLPAFKKKANLSSQSTSKSSSSKSSKKRYSSDDEKSSSKKKSSEKRREQEKRREERRKDVEKAKEDKKSAQPSSSKKNTLSSIYSALYSDTDESKDTDASDGEGRRSSSAKESSDKEKKLRKKKKSPPSPVSRKKPSSTASSSSSENESERTQDTQDSFDERETAAKRSDIKKAVKSKKPSELVDESSQEPPGRKSSGSSSSSSSSASSSDSSSSSSSDNEPETRKKPAPMKRASESLLKSSAAAVEGKVTKTDDDDNEAEESGEPPSHISDHCYAKPTAADEKRENENFENQFANDHGYTRPRTPPAKPAKPAKPASKIAPPKPVAKPATPTIPDEPSWPRKTYKQRSTREEFDIVYKFLTKGLDLEDIKYLKLSYNMMLERQDMSKMLNYTHWVDHTVTDIPEPPLKKRRKLEGDFSKPHLTGSCRSEGYYKMDPREKRRTKYHLQRSDAVELGGLVNTEGSVTKAKMVTAQSMSREARSTQRRQLAVLGDDAITSDLLKFNQLKFRRKNLTFGKSSIHDWGLFAREDIGADEMVIEYVGNVVRPVLSDVREKRYEKQGIGSSYLFRIDQDYVVDATKMGNLARFINHSCDPNCYAKIITIDGEKKIVIYSRQAIAYGEEITYDYKFPIEDEKIHCLCGSKNCRKYLN